MAETPKRRFPKKKSVDDLSTKEVMERVFPKKVRKELEKIAHDDDQAKDDKDNASND